MESQNFEISVVIPVYCSEKTLEELYDRLTQVFLKLQRNYEIIMVDDSSKDNSWEGLKKLRLKDKRMRIIRLANNFGQINALLCGFSFCRGQYVITMDDDLQHPPEEIPKLIAAMDEDPECDVIMGKPIKKRHNKIRNLGSSFGNLMNSLYFRKKLDLKMTSFRIIKKRIIDELVKNKNPNFIIESALLTMTKNIKNIIVEHHPRKVGKSTYSPAKLVRYALKQVINNSISPLRIVSILGIIISVFSFLLGIYYLSQWLINKVTVQGWTSLMVSNLFLFGIVLLSLGIIGEYLIRIIQSINSQQYVISQLDV